MGFVTPLLLGGMLLVGIPIVLHLVMRREARQLVFPALRFIQQRRTHNQHRLRLRHLLLLLLRCAIIALLAFALARPTLRRADATGKEDSPVAAVLVFDNSLRMAYVENNLSRLDRARELATWLLEQLPADCPMTVVDLAQQYGDRDLDRSAAELRIERLTSNPVIRPLDDALRDAATWLRPKSDHRGEIYVFTDLAANEWSQETLDHLAERLKGAPGTNLYVIDVGSDESRNLSLGPLQLSAEELTPGSLLELSSEVTAVGRTELSDDLTVELYLEDSAGPQKRGQEVISVDENGAAYPVEFSLSGLGPGTHQGYIRLIASDPLGYDDIRYFTVEVRPPRKVLLVGESVDDTLFLREALAPSAASGHVGSKFECEVRVFAEVEKTTLADFDAVCLLDPTPLANSAWQSLTDYAHAGGGLGIFLGRNARRDEFNQPSPQQLLPAQLRRQSRDATYLRPSGTKHPALGELSELADAVPWPEFPVFKYWELESLPNNDYVIAPYANGQPAIIERHVGSGRAITMTTPISDPAHNDPWNLLPTAPDPWPFLALANSLAEYLAGAGDAHFNYLPGQTVLIPIGPDERVESFVLQIPGTEAVRQSVAPGQRDVSITSTEALGNYRIRAGGEKSGFDRGFSVNASPELSQLARTDFATIEQALGKDRVRLAHTRDEIEVRVGQGRVGRELFPFLIVAVALVLGAEQLLANRFYQQ